MGFFLLGTQERVRNSRGKRAISVRATEVLLIVPNDFNIHQYERQLLQIEYNILYSIGIYQNTIIHRDS